MADPISPAHYQRGTIQTIELIELLRADFCLGNAIKYLTRAGRKTADPVEDLLKCRWYLTRAINYPSESPPPPPPPPTETLLDIARGCVDYADLYPVLTAIAHACACPLTERRVHLEVARIALNFALNARSA